MGRREGRQVGRWEESRDIALDIALLCMTVVMDCNLLCWVSGIRSSYPLIPGRRDVTSYEAVLLCQALLHHTLGDVSYWARYGGVSMQDAITAILGGRAIVSGGDIVQNTLLYGHFRVTIVVGITAVVVDFQELVYAV